MIWIDCLYININRILLLLVGLWPYQQSKLVAFQLILFFTILTTCVIFQFTTLLTSKCTPDLLIDVFSSASFYIIFVINYSWFRININIVKYLLEQLQMIYNQLTDKNEICIIRKYGKYGKRYTVGLILIAIFTIPIPLLYPFWLYIFDSPLIINDSRPRFPLPHSTEYFVDQKKYFYWILLHANAALLIEIVAILATGSIFLVCQQYACGMFRIASYRIEQSLVVDILQEGSLQNKNMIYKKLIRAVDMHREAMRFSDSSISRFKVMFSFMITAGVISTSLNLFQISQILSFGYDVKKLLFPLIRVITFMFYMFIANYVAQKIIDHNNVVFATAYNIQWYTTSLNVQKMILFLLQRSTKIFSLNIAGLFEGSLESAAMLLSTEISYFTVLYSTQT